MSKFNSATFMLLSFLLICIDLIEAQERRLTRCSAPASSTTSIEFTQPTNINIADGFDVQLVVANLTSPRSILFDKAGALLVVEKGVGVSNIVLDECVLGDGSRVVSALDKVFLVENSNINHGIALSDDGATLYASSAETAWSWDYDSQARVVTSNATVLVTGMTTDDHTTRTLLLSQAVPGLLLISRGSTSNIDLEAASLTSGHSQVKAYNLTDLPDGGYDFDSDGVLLGWGLRNDVGLAEHPVSGGIYTVENSADQITRNGIDIHENNPGEEMNFLGDLNGTFAETQASNFGYPFCFAAWNVSEIPENGHLVIGSQFAIDQVNASDMKNDTYCAVQTAPTLTFQAHMAPLDIKFDPFGLTAYVSFHGSWDRDPPIGYKLSSVAFNPNGTPVSLPTSPDALDDIFWPSNYTACPDGCIRPVGIALKADDIFVASDATGEIYVVSRNESGHGHGHGPGSRPHLPWATGGCHSASVLTPTETGTGIQTPTPDWQSDFRWRTRWLQPPVPSE